MDLSTPFAVLAAGHVGRFVPSADGPARLLAAAAAGFAASPEGSPH